MWRATANHDSAQLDLFTVSMKQAVEHAVSRAFDKTYNQVARAARTDLSKFPPSMTVQMVADYLSVSEKHIRNLIESGLLEAKDVSTPGATKSAFRIDREEVHRYDEAAKEKARKKL
jgi:excisionase family DNA binding protein